MAYTPFDASVPDASTEDLTDMGQSTRHNLKAIRDAVVAGNLAGWNLTPAGGTAEQPATLTYAKGTERVRGSLTWGSSGGADGNVTQAVWEYSSNSGGSYDTIGTVTIAYDTSGNVTSTTWS